MLEREGAVDRVHGGRRIADGSSVEVAFHERCKASRRQARDRAGAYALLLNPRSSVFLDAGTTVLQLARLIRSVRCRSASSPMGSPVAQELLDVPHLEVTVLGGQLRSENASTVGPQAEAMLELLWFDQLFLGASAIGAGRRDLQRRQRRGEPQQTHAVARSAAVPARRLLEIRNDGDLQCRAAGSEAHRHGRR